MGAVRANQLAERKPVSFDTIKRMKAFFDRHEKNADGEIGSDPSNGKIAWALWGGDPGRRWAETTIKRIEGKNA